MSAWLTLWMSRAASEKPGLRPREKTNMATAIGTKANTGERCPESGVWKVVGTPSTTAPIARGNVMPPYGGKAVTWELIQRA
jgi:hypothetical protein